MKTKKEIQEYIKERSKNSFVTTYFSKGKEYISFYDKEKGWFKGRVERSGDSEKAVKKYAGVKVKLTFKLPNERAKKTVTYQVYNKKQQKEILYRMNSRLREPSRRKDYKNFGFTPKAYKKDAVPFIQGKNKVDMLLDQYKFVDIQKVNKYEGVSA